MKFPTRHFVLFCIISCCFSYSLISNPSNDAKGSIKQLPLFEQAQKIRYSYPDSALTLLDKCFAQFVNRGDTSSAVKALMIDANIRGNLAHYKDAYDKLWQALFLADKAALMRQKADIYIEIGRHYSFYKRRLKALHYFQISKQLNLDLLRQAEVSEAALVSNYYAFCSTYRELGDYDLARQYLDSCFYYFVPQKSPIDRAFLQFELASIQTAERDYATALETYKAVQPWFEEFEPSYLVLFYTYLSDAYLGLEQYDESEKYYKKALQISDEYNMHIDFSVIIHEKLSDLYLQKGEYPNAYSSLKTVKELDAKFFDSRSDNNQSLLEIQDAFRQEQETQQKLIQEQKLERLEHEEDVWFLQRVILISSILFILTIGYLYFSYLRAKYRADKQIIRKEKELELKKANEVLELKNKELAASALKLIEKDENLSLLKSKIKEASGSLDVNELKKVVRSISVSNNRNWEEFEARFIAVNQDFYKRVQERFPKLSQRDLKLCALIKLNFSSKEMAKLLGISVESAHTSRYRLRKKMQLTRDVNLTEFIANL